MFKRYVLFFVGVMFVNVGCSSKFACKDAVNGVSCNSIAAVYEKEFNGTPLPKKKGKKGKKGKKELPPANDGGVEIVKRLGAGEDLPLRTPPKVIRVWIAPWEDSDGDLHQPEYVYSEISDIRGRWLFGEKETGTPVHVIAPTELPRPDSQEGKK